MKKNIDKYAHLIPIMNNFLIYWQDDNMILALVLDLNKLNTVYYDFVFFFHIPIIVVVFKRK